MEVITIESGLWQQLLNRIERIETYVKEATAPVNISDEDIILNNDQACRLLCVEKRTMQYYRSEGKIARNYLHPYVRNALKRKRKSLKTWRTDYERNRHNRR